MAIILVVDDRPINREFLASLLTHVGHDVHQAGDGLEALEIARRIEPALVITDILMPTMDGVEFVRRLSVEPKLHAVPVIFYTATYRVGEARVLAEGCGVSTVIPKPSEPQTILDAVQGELGLAERVVAPAMVESTGAHRVLAVDRLCSVTVGDLTGLQSQLRSTLEQDDTPSGKARRLRQISTRMDTSLSRAQALSMRLAALVELGLDLATQHEPESMLAMFCHAGKDIMNAKLAAVCAFDEHGQMIEFAASGMPRQQALEVRRDLVPTEGVFGDVMRTGVPQRHAGTSDARAALGFPSSHPPFTNALIVPVQSESRMHGWFYVADRLGETVFAEEDEQLAQTLAAQLTPTYENLVLYDQVRRHAGLLEVEVAERRHALGELAESEIRFRQLAENIRDVFFLVDAATGNMLYVSPIYAEVWDRSRESLYAKSDSWLDAVHPDDREHVVRRYRQSRQSGEFKLKYRIYTSRGVRWVKAQTFPIRDPSGAVYRIAGIAEDVTESELQQRRIERLSRIQAVLSGINSAIVRIHERSALLDEACRIAVMHGGFPVAWIGLVQPRSGRIEFVAYAGRDRSVADEVSHILVDDSVSRTEPVASALRTSAHAVFNEIPAEPSHSRLFRLARENRYGSAVALPLTPNGKPSGTIVLLAEEPNMFDAEELRLLDELASDVSFALEYIAQKEHLHYLAYYDALTDLPNTEMFHELLAQSLERGIGALFLIDLDRFTHLNDTLGRHVGDQLLAAVGKRLKSTLASNSHLARIGSDTFAIAVPALSEATEAGTVLKERIFAALGRPFAVGRDELRVSARVGVAVFPADGQTPGTLFKNAEASLKEAKTSGARYVFYSSELNARVAENLALEQDLLAAVEKREFELHYQPKIDSASGAVIGLEALLRWNRPEHGLEPPARFIPALEASELILDVGQWVVEQTLLDYEAWREKGLEPPPVAVNVSPLQLRYSDFAEMVLTMMLRHGVGERALELEITESAIMADIESSKERLQQLSESGVMIAIDDFGTGYSSLRYLAELPLHSLKIDRSFVAAMTREADKMTLVSTIIGLAHSFKLRVVAEGVESEEQAKLLRLMKCDSMQGYLFGRPQPARQIDALLAARRTR